MASCCSGNVGEKAGGRCGGLAVRPSTPDSCCSCCVPTNPAASDSKLNECKGGDCCRHSVAKPPATDNCGPYCGPAGSACSDSEVDKCKGDNCCSDSIARPSTPDNCGSCCSPTDLASSDSKVEESKGDNCREDNRCDETCIKTAAAIECSIACADQQVGCSSDTGSRDSVETTHRNGCNTCCDIVDSQVVEPKKCKNIQIDTSHDHAHGEDGRHPEEPCNAHLKAAIEKYTAYLESARCICRSIIASASRVDSCCSQPTAGGSDASGVSNERKSVLSRRLPCRNRSIRKQPVRSEIKCCGNAELVDSIAPEQKQASKVVSVDIEKAAGLSHVLLNVTGMDCSGCANNLTRALRNSAGIENVKVIFIGGTAEFDLDAEVNTLENVIRSAQHATGYKLTPFSSDTQSIDIVMSAREANRFQNHSPRGVERCEKISKTTYEISYDPCIVGARDMLSGLDAQLGPPRDGSNADKGKRRLIRVFALTTLAFMLTTPVVTLEWGRPSGVSEHKTLIVAVVLATLVQGIAVSEFYIPAISSLIYNKVVEMDMLVVISITAAYVYSVIAACLFFAGIDLETKPFFETSTLLITLILFGRLLATWARRRAVKTVSLRSLQASRTMLIDQTTGAVAEIDARLLQFGDKITILPHSQVVTDAKVLEGTSEVDESMLTGESLPVLKKAGDTVVSGTMNGGGRLTALVSRLPGKNTITDIANLVEQAQGFKPHVQDLADKVAGYFVPVVCTIALIVFLVWVVVVLKVRGDPASNALGTAIGYCVAVLAITCPCALGLAVPMVLVVAGGVAARAGVIIKTADVIERGFKVNDVIFDKTGTLTEPILEVVQEKILPTAQVGEEAIRSIVMTMVKGNKHPVSEAVAKALEGREICSLEVEGLVSSPGCGVEAQWQGMTVRAGNAKWLNINETPQVIDFAAQGLTMLCVTFDGRLAAIFGLKSRLREGAARVVRELQQRQIAVHIVSGDNRSVVEGVAAELGIHQENVSAERTPAQKQDYVRQLMDAGKITLFCGDGTNDAVAVAQANVGVQIESSSDVTRATADVVILHNLDGVVNLLDVSKAAFRRIVFNFVWSGVYNVCAILLASGAFVRVRVPPAYAGLGEIVSVLPVIVVALTQPKLKARS